MHNSAEHEIYHAPKYEKKIVVSMIKTWSFELNLKPLILTLKSS